MAQGDPLVDGTVSLEVEKVVPPHLANHTDGGADPRQTRSTVQHCPPSRSGDTATEATRSPALGQSATRPDGSNRGEPVAEKFARRVRRAAWGNGPGAIWARQADSTIDREDTWACAVRNDSRSDRCGGVRDLPGHPANLPHRGGRDGVSEPDEFALHAPVPPRRIVRRDADDKLADRGCRGRSSGTPPACVIPFSGDQAMPLLVCRKAVRGVVVVVWSLDSACVHGWVYQNDVRLGAVARWVTRSLSPGRLIDCGINQAWCAPCPVHGLLHARPGLVPARLL